MCTLRERDVGVSEGIVQTLVAGRRGAGLGGGGMDGSLRGCVI